MNPLFTKVLSEFTDYKVDILGNVYSDKRQGSKGGRLNPYKNKFGYCFVSLRNGNKQTLKQVHRLIAESFIPNPENKPQVNHINGIKTDNRAANLEWATPLENSRHSWSIGLCKSYSKGKLGYNSLAGQEVIQYLGEKEIARFGSARQASIITGISTSSISSCINGKVEKAKGFKWVRSSNLKK